MKLTLDQARTYLALLHFADRRIAADADPLAQLCAHVRRLGCVQYDPLDVVGRNADLVLQSRVPGYKPEMLYKALYEDRTLFEGLDKNFAIYPAEDFPAFARTRVNLDQWHRASDEVRALFPLVLAEIERRGPLCSDDLPAGEKVGWAWGPTRPARAALESLWLAGRLGMHHRKGTRHYFDLIERCLPAEILARPDPNPTDADYFRWQLKRRIRSVGLLSGGASDALLGAGMKAADRTQALDSLLERGEILPVEIAEAKLAGYIAAADEEVLERARREAAPPDMRVIAPLDNLMWDRRLIEVLFGFRYRWEVYVPKAQRRYGYYVLPVFCGNRFVARFEPEKFRGGALRIRTWWWERDAVPEALRPQLAACLDRFCAFLGAEGWEIGQESVAEG